ncbi:hypothetical protein MMC11_007606 [Xylographa trunciseda]|nr:hypothetical protein [Xylographa trunciseda]
MPKLKDILVQVTVDDVDKNGEKTRIPLDEWGIQKLKKKKISAYIEAETGKRFRILVQPKIPFPSKLAPEAHEYNTRQKAKARENGLETTRPGFCKTKEDRHNEDADHNPPGNLDQFGRGADARRRRSISDASMKIKEEPTDEPVTFSSPAPSMEMVIKRTPPPPFDLLASLYLDGRKKPEHRVIIHLDPDNEYFESSGCSEINSRWVQDKDGNINEQSWIFQDVGIETLFDKMLIAGDSNITPVAEGNEAELVDAFHTIYLNGDGDSGRGEKSMVGQILVTIDRIKLGKTWISTKYRAKHKEHKTEEVDMTYAGKDITHTTGFTHKKLLYERSEGIYVTNYSEFNCDEDSFATFQFFYRSKSVLQKFNFEGLPKTISRGLPSKRSNMAFMTPLSISSSTSKACAAGRKDKNVAFENDKRKIKGKGLFSGPAFGLSLNLEDAQSLKKEEPKSLEKDHSKTKLLSLSSLLPKGDSLHMSPSASSLESRHQARYNLRSCSGKNRKSLQVTGHVNHRSYSGPDPSLYGASFDSQGPKPPLCITSSSGVEDGSLESTREAGNTSASAPYKLSNLGSILRDNSNDVAEADDERELSELKIHLDIDKDPGESQTCQNKDDQGLSLGVKELVLGKRVRESEDRDLGETGIRAKRVAL